MKNFFTKAAVLLSSISAGIFLIGYNIGTGSITTMASAGSEYGMTLTWALLLSCVFTYYLIIAFSRYTMVTGRTVLHSFRCEFGAPVTLFIPVVDAGCRTRIEHGADGCGDRGHRRMFAPADR